MSDPFIGEIRMFAGNFAPDGWAFCNGQLLSISDNDTLFTLIGTTYGGDGQTTFGLPDLRGRIPLHSGNGTGLKPRILGENAGAEEVPLFTNHLPAHNHPLRATAQNANEHVPTGYLLANTTTDIYIPNPPNVDMSPQSIGPVGGSVPHTNVMPFLCVNFIISLFGIFPNSS